MNRELTISTATTRTSTYWNNQLTTKQDLTARIYEPIALDIDCMPDHKPPHTALLQKLENPTDQRFQWSVRYRKSFPTRTRT